jgi:hypothetical protein
MLILYEWASKNTCFGDGVHFCQQFTSPRKLSVTMEVKPKARKIYLHNVLRIDSRYS